MKVICDRCRVRVAQCVRALPDGEAPLCECCEAALATESPMGARLPLANTCADSWGSRAVACQSCQAVPGVVFSYTSMQVYCCGCDAAIHAGKSQQECPRFLIFGNKLPAVSAAAKSGQYANSLPRPPVSRAQLELLPPPTALHHALPPTPTAANHHAALPALAPILADDWLTGVHLADDLYDAATEVVTTATPPPTHAQNAPRVPLDCAAALAAAEAELAAGETGESLALRLAQQHAPPPPPSHHHHHVHHHHRTASNAKFIPTGAAPPPPPPPPPPPSRNSRPQAPPSPPANEQPLARLTSSSSGSQRGSPSPSASGGVADAMAPTTARRCVHCGTTSTPQWRAGPAGHKTLCNACGVRFKAGRLAPSVNFPPPPVNSAPIATTATTAKRPAASMSKAQTGWPCAAETSAALGIPNSASAVHLVPGVAIDTTDRNVRRRLNAPARFVTSE